MHGSNQHLKLWVLLKAWVWITDQEAFDRQWEMIKTMAPVSIVWCLETEWWAEQDLWLAVTHRD
jgi:hypothetical protein